MSHSAEPRAVSSPTSSEGTSIPRLEDLREDMATIIVSHSDISSVACLACTAKFWQSICAPALLDARSRELAGLAKSLARISTLGRSIASIACGSRCLLSLTQRERTLLSWLSHDLTPLLDMDTRNAKISSWLLMRLMMCSGGSLEDLLFAHAATETEGWYNDVVWSPNSTWHPPRSSA